MSRPLGVDIVELSGGSYDAPVMQCRTYDQCTLARGAYFLEFAENIAKKVSIPINTTGDIRRAGIAEKVIKSDMPLAVMASVLAYCPDLPNKWRQGSDYLEHIP
jgi:2,4-dienoyl-CoA reductase-like NADH-dependent reductase (Old Yellow Enzyme family)